jgi:hypothetical protein
MRAQRPDRPPPRLTTVPGWNRRCAGSGKHCCVELSRLGGAAELRRVQVPCCKRWRHPMCLRAALLSNGKSSCSRLLLRCLAHLAVTVRSGKEGGRWETMQVADNGAVNCCGRCVW